MSLFRKKNRRDRQVLPFYDEETASFLVSKKFVFYPLKKDNKALLKYGIRSTEFDFSFVHVAHNIRIDFVGDMIYISGWFQDEYNYSGEWYLRWMFSNPGNTAGFKSILKSYAL